MSDELRDYIVALWLDGWAPIYIAMHLNTSEKDIELTLWQWRASR